jgi:hypothetical protein
MSRALGRISRLPGMREPEFGLCTPWSTKPTSDWSYRNDEFSPFLLTLCNVGSS